MFSDFRLLVHNKTNHFHLKKHSVLPFDLPFHYDIILRMIFTNNGFTENDIRFIEIKSANIFLIKNKFIS